MQQQSVHSNNLPTSFDVSPLLSKLKSVEGDYGGNLIQRVRLIELDPYCHQPARPSDGQANQPTGNVKTRLFLAAAFGKRVVVAQLIASEVGSAIDGDGGEAEGGSEEDLEWLDVSNETGCGGPAVVYPPSYAEPLPASNGGGKSGVELPNKFLESKDDGALGAEIATCSLIPPPAIRTVTPNSTSKTMTQRAVSLLLGTEHDHVISLLLRVSHVSAGSDEERRTRFSLEYDECRAVEDGKLHEDISRDPCAHQILPYTKRLGAERGSNGKDSLDNDGSGPGGWDNLDEDVKVFHPSVQSSTPQNEFEHAQGENPSGIKSIAYCRDNTNSRRQSGYRAAINEDGTEVTMSQDIIWITYGNGAIVKLPSWKPFIALHSSDAGHRVDFDAVDGTKSLRNGSSVTPFCSLFVSPLDVPPPQANHRVVPGDDTQLQLGPVTAGEYCNLLTSAVSSRSRDHADPSAQAIVIEGPSASASSLPIAFNSSRVKCNPVATAQEPFAISEQGLDSQGSNGMNESSLNASSDDENYGPVTGTVVEGTASLVKGGIRVAFGALRWGLGTGAGVNKEHGHDEDTPLDEFMDAEETADNDSSNHSPSLPSEQLERRENVGVHHQFAGRGREVKDLFPWPLNSASFPFSDIPRRFETATVDPSGTLVATTDNLGRVILFDLETSQPIRMFKGMRNASCYFAELPRSDGKSKSQLYLVVHLRQRGAVEIYRLRQGPRVAAVAVPEQRNCAVIECHGPPTEGGRVDTFVVESVDESGGNEFIIDKLVIDDAVVAKPSPTKTAARQGESTGMQLRIFMQLLAPDTSIQCNAQTVLATFKSIRALADLGEGLDALSKSTRLESMGMDSASVHSEAVAYCRSRLNHAKQAEAQEGSGMVRKTAISELSLKLAYHDRLSHAFSVLRRYELKADLKAISSDDVRVADQLSHWASESLSWISAASGNEASRTRFMPSSRDVNSPSDNEPLQFSKFAEACQFNGETDKVYLSKVKRGRLPILKRIFRPLRQDLFVFKVVNSLLGHLGLEDDFRVQQQYFSEWVQTIATDDIARSNLSGTWRPMSRWLQDLILSAYDASQQGEAKEDDALLKETTMLSSILKFCEEMEDLPKAFMLAVICMDAVSSATVTLEQKTYGKVTQLTSVQPWEILLRKLRVCLLVSLRLHGNVDPLGGVNPMTVSNVSRSDVFSVYSWIAQDELSHTHDNQVLVALETACLSSSEAFYPSTADGDEAQRKKAMFQSCNRPEGLSLLFYLKDYARLTARLAANRALILSTTWGKMPERLHLLDRAISSLQIVVAQPETFSLAALVEIYQSRFRPVCRAMLFGFGEHELNEEVFLPLIENSQWTSDFVSLAKQILSMIIEFMSKTPSANSIDATPSEMWPPLRECPILATLATRLPAVDQASAELHHTMIFAYEMTGDVASLEFMVPSYPNLFLTGSLFSVMPPMPKASAQEMNLLDKAIVDHAEKTTSPVVDNFASIKSVELFGAALGVDTKYVRTHYLIEMIRRGKDTSIDDLLGASGSSLDKAPFADAAVEIICLRLNATILSLKQTKNYRGILGLLDAETSRWVREVSSKYSPSQQKMYATASLISTHSMITRIQGMTDGVDDTLAEKIDALSLMSGTLLKAVQKQEQEAVMNV